MKALNPHIKMILNRYLMKVFAVAHFRAHLAVLHFKYADILCIGLAVEVILLDAGGHAFHVTFTAGDIKGIAEQNIFNGRLGTHLDIDAPFHFG